MISIGKDKITPKFRTFDGKRYRLSLQSKHKKNIEEAKKGAYKNRYVRVVMDKQHYNLYVLDDKKKEKKDQVKK